MNHDDLSHGHQPDPAEPPPTWNSRQKKVASMAPWADRVSTAMKQALRPVDAAAISALHNIPPGILAEAPPQPFVEPGYERLADVLSRAFDQAARGKGKERHAQGLPFHAQPMQNLIGLYGPGFAAGQAAKKAQEAARLPHDAKIKELLGAIVYLAGLVVYEEARHAE